ncbi:MAG: GNAT family N-acetyltransferase, partial [Gemmatimonadaceae bacterium]
MSPVIEVVRTYLQLRTPEQLRAVPLNDPTVTFVRREAIGVEHYRRLYKAVGDNWHWHDRNAWSDERMAAYLASPTVYVWEALAGNETAGYFEMERHDDGGVEIVYFGLAGAFIGRGLGKAMLTRAAEIAWSLDARLVWLHTCTLDSPHALPNYKARGFEEVRKETYVY